ncbi:MAG: tail fiber domain-containing protein [Dyadobacter sp.]|uniref:tail fiber domain-containing protein n=1 Tax=Dyadobacter sp. TaxID=1914288 RepID=UPI001B222DC7|nr:tail fiber domain-containing protein [Dyadobacter sp.]MBO9613767.1 tail fiber domain-containing protein [Dyadobacter sp.]
MNKWYKVTGALLLGVCAMTQVNAQTHYGAGAGTLGPGHAFFGTQAGASNTANGLDNSFFGHQSGFSNLDGVHNVFVGSQAGYFNNSVGNVFVGYKSGFQSVSGPFNTFVGGYAGQNNLNGGANFFGGYSTGYQNTTGSYNTFLGAQTAIENKTGQENVFVGYTSGNNNSSGNFNVFLGVKSGKSNVSGSSNTYIGYQADGTTFIQNATAIGANAKVTMDNSLVLGYKANVGIGVSAPSFQLHLSTDAAAKAGSPDWTVASDSRLKRNITNFTDGLDLLKQIRPVWFQYNGQAGIETGDKKFVGIVAQEMEKIAPYTIGTFTHQDSLGNKTEYLDYDANAVTYILINSVKEQQRVIEQKDAELKEMNAQVAALEKSQYALMARLEALEQNRSSAVGFQKADESQETPYLEQNAPNGFTGQTSIKYFVPSSAKDAVINIYDKSARKVGSHRLIERGAGELQLSAESYRSGLHVYDLVIDGKVVGSRKMLVE